MTPKKFWEHTNGDTKERERVARDADTTLANLRHIALYRGGCSAPLARRLEIASGGRMTVLEILFSDEIDDRPETKPLDRSDDKAGGGAVTR